MVMGESHTNKTTNPEEPESTDASPQLQGARPAEELAQLNSGLKCLVCFLFVWADDPRRLTCFGG